MLDGWRVKDKQKDKGTIEVILGFRTQPEQDYPQIYHEHTCRYSDIFPYFLPLVQPTQCPNFLRCLQIGKYLNKNCLPQMQRNKSRLCGRLTENSSYVTLYKGQTAECFFSIGFGMTTTEAPIIHLYPSFFFIFFCLQTFPLSSLNPHFQSTTPLCRNPTEMPGKEIYSQDHKKNTRK